MGTSDLRVDAQRNHQCGDPEDEQDIENVAADHVADGDVGLTRENGGDRHRGFRGACAKRHYRKTHHQRRYPERQCELGGPSHQSLGTQHESDDSKGEHHDFGHVLTSCRLF
jgi:hypothetical protein